MSGTATVTGTSYQHQISTTTTAWKRTFGCSYHALAVFRIALALLLLSEILLRFRYIHPFYSDEGTLPLSILNPKIDAIYKILCIHCLSGSILFQQLLLSLQVGLATCLLIGYKPQTSAFLSWLLYLSLTLRNTWLSFILDRYFHYLLFYASFLPTGEVYTLFRPSSTSSPPPRPSTTILTPATMALKLQILWIYLDAGGGKILDPNQGWSFNASPLPALDTYARHTLGARYLYALLTPTGLRFLTPIVAHLEVLGPLMALGGSVLGWEGFVTLVVVVMVLLHGGIAVTIRNTWLLSGVAAAAWGVYLPCGWGVEGGEGKGVTGGMTRRRSSSSMMMWEMVAVGCFVLGSLWFETMSDDCQQSVKHVWSTLLHNRWNVFVGAEEYVTWEIAPGRLANGTVVDIWSKTEHINWNMPGAGAPCTSTARGGRWRSFPYLAGLEGTHEGDVLWGYLCRQWDMENDAENSPGRRLLRFNFFMMQADVLPEMEFSASRKRLIHSHVCVEEEQEKIAMKEEKGGGDEL